MKYLLALLVLSIVIIVHEFGHYIVAKASGVQVIEFSIGMGPRIAKFTRKGTMYSLKLFLFGGACVMKADDEDDQSEGSFSQVSIWKRIAIVIAGPLFNFLLAFVFAVFLIGKMGYDPVMVGAVDENSTAYEAGLAEGDLITEINGKKMTFYGDYSLYMYEHDGEVLNIKYKRDGKTYNATLTPEHVTGKVYQMGVYMEKDEPIVQEAIKGKPAVKAGLKAKDKILSIDGIAVSTTAEVSPIVRACDGKAITVVVDRAGKEETIKFVPEYVEENYYDYGISFSNARIKLNPAKTIKYSMKQVSFWIKAVFKGLKMLFTGKVGIDGLAGPVGVVTTIGDVVEESKADGAFYVLLNLINWMIMISANLGVMNLLPIPALDGGKLLFLIIEAVRKKPVPKEKEGIINFIGVILLLLITVVVLFNDIAKIFR